MPPRAEVPPPNHFNDDESVDPAESNQQDELPEFANVLPGLIQSIESHLDDVSVLEEGLGLLSRVATSHAQDVIRTEGAVEQVFAALERHQDNERLVNIALILLLKLVSDTLGEEEEGEAISSAIREANGVVSICAAVECHPSDEEVQSDGAILLAALLTYDTLRNAVIEANGLSIIVSAMAFLPTHGTLPSFVGNAFHMMMNSDGSTMKDILEDAGVVPVFVQIIKQCSESVSEGSTGALVTLPLVLGRLADDRDSIKNTVLDLEGIPALVRVLENHYTNSDVAMHTLTAVHFLMAERDDIRDAFLAAGIAAPLHNILQFHEDNVVALTTSAQMLAELTSDCSVAANTMVNMGVLATITKIVSVHIDRIELILKTLAATCTCLDAFESSSKWEILDSVPQLIHCMFEVIRTHSTHHDLLAIASTIVNSLADAYARYRGLNQQIITPNDFATLVHVMKLFPESEAIHYPIFGVFETLASINGMAKSVRDSGFCSALFELMHRLSPSENTEFLVDALILLLELVNVQYITKEDIAKVNGFCLLESLKESSDDSVSHRASAVLHFDYPKT